MLYLTRPGASQQYPGSNPHECTERQFASDSCNTAGKHYNISDVDDTVVFGTQSQSPKNDLSPAEPLTQASAGRSIEPGRPGSRSGSAPDASIPESLILEASPPKGPHRDSSVEPDDRVISAMSSLALRNDSNDPVTDEENDDDWDEEEIEVPLTKEEIDEALDGYDGKKTFSQSCDGLRRLLDYQSA